MPVVLHGDVVKVHSTVPRLLRDQVVSVVEPYGGTVSAMIRRLLEEFVVEHADELPEGLRLEPETESA